MHARSQHERRRAAASPPLTRSASTLLADGSGVFLPALSFFESAPQIRASRLFKLLQPLPKRSLRARRETRAWQVEA